MIKLSKGNPGEKKERTISAGRSYFEFSAKLMISIFFIHAFLLQLFVIPTPSMEGTLLVGDHLVVDRVAYSGSLSRIDGLLLPQVGIGHGMVVAFKAPVDLETECVKRVIGLPGDRLRISGRQVWINGRPLPEPYTRFQARACRVDFPPSAPFRWEPQFPRPLRRTRTNSDGSVDYVVPPGHFFCMGDNRDRSFDSRYWGPVPAEYINGKPWRIYWSIRAESKDYLTPGLAHQLKVLLLTAMRFLSHTRWERTVQAIE